MGIEFVDLAIVSGFGRTYAVVYKGTILKVEHAFSIEMENMISPGFTEQRKKCILAELAQVDLEPLALALTSPCSMIRAYAEIRAREEE